MPVGFGEVSFGGAVLHVFESTPGFFPLPVQEVIEEETHVPYSDTTVVDDGGLGPHKWGASVRVPDHAHAGFEALNGTRDTFILYDDNKGTAKLKILSAAVYAALSEYRYSIEVVW